MSIIRYTAAVAFNAASIIVPVYGAEAELPEEIIVTAPTGDFLQPTQILEGSELLLRKATTLGETLSDEPGINASAYGKGASRPIIRGQAGPRVQVLKGNIASLDVSALSPDHNPTVDPLLLDRIEVVRGPSTLAYGSAAAGGVVNVFDGRIPSAPESPDLTGAVEVRGDTVSESKAVVGRLDGVLGRIGWHIDGSSGDSSDYDISGFATADPAERPVGEKKGTQPNSFVDKVNSYSGGLSLLSDDGYVGVSLSQYETNYGLVGPEADSSGGPFIEMEETRTDVRGEYGFNGPVKKIRFAVGINNYQHTENEADGEEATRFDNDEWEARIEVEHAKFGALSGVVGLQVNDRDLKASGEEAFIPDSKANRWGFFVLEDLETAAGEFQFGARVDTADIDNKMFKSYDEKAYSLAAGFSRLVSTDYEFTANVSLSERHPDIEELYSDGLHIATNQVEIGLLAQGLSVDQEMATNLDFGFARIAGRWQWSANAFYTDYDGYVYQRIDGQEAVDGELFNRALYTQDDAEFWGAEVDVSFALIENKPYQLDVRLFGDFVKAELDDGSDLPRLPPMRGGLGVDFQNDRWRSTLQATYHAKQDEISSFNTDSFTIVDLSIIYNVPIKNLNWEVFLKGSNLLDMEARASTSFVAEFSQLPGRNLMAGARLSY